MMIKKLGIAQRQIPFEYMQGIIGTACLMSTNS